MSILTTKTVWRRPRAIVDTVNPEKLTPEQEERVRVALKFLHKRFGTWAALAKAMGVKPETLQQSAFRARRAPTSGMAIRAARVAVVPIERILSGLWPPKNVCPHCGQTTPTHR